MDLEKYRCFLAEVILTRSYGCQVSICTNEDSCAICLCPMKDDQVIKLSCTAGHTYHKDCYIINLVEYKFNKCPDCMELIQQQQLQPVADDSSVDLR